MAMPFFHLSEWVIRSLTRPDPVTFEHSLSPGSGPSTFSIPFDIEDPGRAQLQAVLDTLQSPARTSSLLAHDSKLADSSAQIKSHQTTRDFLAAFAADPKAFIATWLDSQAADLEDALAVDDRTTVLGASAEEMRRAGFWKQGWVEDALNVYSSRMVEGFRAQAVAAGAGAAGRR
jgi:SWI/SNF-related matrix-associated actin-dependent regulator of chromatin subfamily D